MRRLPGPVMAALAGTIVVGVTAVTVLLMLPGDDSGTASPNGEPSAHAGSPLPSSTPRPSATASPTPSPTPAPVAYCPVTGLPLAAELPDDRTGLMVQIDNDPHARPQTGLASADVIVEATVQGNVTRFGALFYCQDPVQVGPIRSARFYNLDLWQQMHALTVGFGGAPYTIQHFADGGMPYLNGQDGWGYFKRSAARIAPYNVYADPSTIRGDLSAGRLDRFKVGIDQLRPPFAVDRAAEVPVGRAVGKIEVRTTNSWRYSFTYDRRAGGYVRADGSTKMVDAASGDPVIVRSVVVQRVSQRVIYGIDFGAGGNPILHDLVGDGNGTLYVDGRALPVQWSRPSANDATTWTYADDGKPVVLPPGPIWWQILPVAATITEQ